MIVEEDSIEIERIDSHRFISDKLEYRIKFKGYGMLEWIPASYFLCNKCDFLDKYNKKNHIIFNGDNSKLLPILKVKNEKTFGDVPSSKSNPNVCNPVKKIKIEKNVDNIPPQSKISDHIASQCNGIVVTGSSLDSSLYSAESLSGYTTDYDISNKEDVIKTEASVSNPFASNIKKPTNSKNLSINPKYPSIPKKRLSNDVTYEKNITKSASNKSNDSSSKFCHKKNNTILNQKNNVLSSKCNASVSVNKGKSKNSFDISANNKASYNQRTEHNHAKKKDLLQRILSKKMVTTKDDISKAPIFRQNSLSSYKVDKESEIDKVKSKINKPVHGVVPTVGLLSQNSNHNVIGVDIDSNDNFTKTDPVKQMSSTKRHLNSTSKHISKFNSSTSLKKRKNLEVIKDRLLSKLNSNTIKVLPISSEENRLKHSILPVIRPTFFPKHVSSTHKVSTHKVDSTKVIDQPNNLNNKVINNKEEVALSNKTNKILSTSKNEIKKVSERKQETNHILSRKRKFEDSVGCVDSSKLNTNISVTKSKPSVKEKAILIGPQTADTCIKTKTKLSINDCTTSMNSSSSKKKKIEENTSKDPLNDHKQTTNNCSTAGKISVKHQLHNFPDSSVDSSLHSAESLSGFSTDGDLSTKDDRVKSPIVTRLRSSNHKQKSVKIIENDSYSKLNTKVPSNNDGNLCKVSSQFEAPSGITSPFSQSNIPYFADPILDSWLSFTESFSSNETEINSSKLIQPENNLSIIKKPIRLNKVQNSATFNSDTEPKNIETPMNIDILLPVIATNNKRVFDHILRLYDRNILSRIVKENPCLLVIAAINDTLVMVNTLLNLGANVNGTDHSGTTALIAACNSGNEMMLDLLIKRGADVNIMSNGRNKVLEKCIMSNNLRLFKRVLSAKADYSSVEHLIVDKSTELAIILEEHKKRMLEPLNIRIRSSHHQFYKNIVERMTAHDGLKLIFRDQTEIPSSLKINRLARQMIIFKCVNPKSFTMEQILEGPLQHSFEIHVAQNEGQLVADYNGKRLVTTLNARNTYYVGKEEATLWKFSLRPYKDPSMFAFICALELYVSAGIDENKSTVTQSNINYGYVYDPSEEDYNLRRSFNRLPMLSVEEVQSRLLFIDVEFRETVRYTLTPINITILNYDGVAVLDACICPRDRLRKNTDTGYGTIEENLIGAMDEFKAKEIIREMTRGKILVSCVVKKLLSNLNIDKESLCGIRDLSNAIVLRKLVEQTEDFMDLKSIAKKMGINEEMTSTAVVASLMRRVYQSVEMDWIDDIVLTEEDDRCCLAEEITASKDEISATNADTVYDADFLDILESLL